MSFSIKIERNAYKTLSLIQKKDRIRVIKAIDNLKENPALGKQLSGEWKGLRRIRVGNHRVVYAVKQEELLIMVVRIGHRKEVYR